MRTAKKWQAILLSDRQIPGIFILKERRGLATVQRADSGRAGDSFPRDRDHSAFSIGGELKAGEDVLMLEFREVLEDLLLAHARREVLKDIVDGDAHAADARFSTALAVFDRDAIQMILMASLRREAPGVSCRRLRLRQPAKRHFAFQVSFAGRRSVSGRPLFRQIGAEIAEDVACFTSSGASLVVGANPGADILIPDWIDLGRLRPFGLLEYPLGESRFLVGRSPVAKCPRGQPAPAA